VGLNRELNYGSAVLFQFEPKQYPSGRCNMNAELCLEGLAKLGGNCRAMKPFKFYHEINPIFRDLMLVFLAGLFASAAMVTLGYMIFLQV
jgi:hypothetical protein